MKLNAFSLALTIGMMLYPASQHAIEIDKIDLPDLGDSSGSLLSPIQEQKYGAEFYRQLHTQIEINQDPEIQHYIDTIGKKLVAHSDNPGYPFHFFVVLDNGINAFAGPGGYIGVNSGLITLTEEESELASVMAHEIAHVTQRHLYRAAEASQRMTFPNLALLGAAIAASVLAPGLGQGPMIAAMAGMAQFQINFTRSNEQEADRVGMQTLSEANFDPRSMPTFFERLQQSTRYYGANVPEFVRTHPVTESRIADTRGRAESYPYRQYPSSQGFELARTKLQIAGSNNRKDLQQFFQFRVQQGTESQRAVARYALALLAIKAHDVQKAESILNELVASYPEQPEFYGALARSALEAKDYAKALSLFKSCLQRFPDNEAIQVEYINTLLAAGQPEAARRLLQPLMKVSPQPIYYSMLAQAYGGLNKPAEWHRYLAEYYYATGETTAAIMQIKLAKKTKNMSFYLASILEERLNFFMAEELETRRNDRR